MNNSKWPGVIAVFKINYPIKEKLSISDLKSAEEISIIAFRKTFDYDGIDIHITSSSLKLSSIIVEVSIWVGGIASFLKLYPSIKKGFLEILQDIQHLINKMSIEKLENDKETNETIDSLPKVELSSVVEQLPKYDEILIMGIDFYQLYTLSKSRNGYVRDAKYLIKKLSESGNKLSINFDSVFSQLIQEKLGGFDEASKALEKFGEKYVLVFRLGMQVMNMNNAMSYCYETRNYKVVDRVCDQVISYMSDLGFDNAVIHETKRVQENIRELILLSHDEFEKESRHIGESIINLIFNNL